MTRKIIAILLSLMLICTPAFAEEVTQPGEWMDNGFQFTGAGAIDYTMTIKEDGSYFFLLAIQNYTGTEAQQVKFTAVTEGFMEETIVTAEPGMAGRTFFFKDMTAGDYTITVENLIGGECLFTGCMPYSYVRLETMDGATMDQAESNCFVTTLTEETTFTATYSGGMFASFFTTADQTITLPAGEAILYYVMPGVTTVEYAK